MTKRFHRNIYNYVLTVPAVREERGGYSNYWKVTISDSEGELLYTDEEGFPARFNVYWTWDDSDRAWLYNSDDGCIYYWEYKGVWTKTKHEKKTDSLRIPDDLLPPYAE
ncbi:hypothetical protein JXA84_01450 [candidate division WOR-3 bacterium]|nr:hypothetical protein [candidate division WOR-3 bacterium]